MSNVFTGSYWIVLTIASRNSKTPFFETRILLITKEFYTIQEDKPHCIQTLTTNNLLTKTILKFPWSRVMWALAYSLLQIRCRLRSHALTDKKLKYNKRNSQVNACNNQQTIECSNWVSMSSLLKSTIFLELCLLFYCSQFLLDTIFTSIEKKKINI